MTEEILRTAADLLYPRRCPVCGGIAPWKQQICPECVSALPVIEGRRCRKCGKPVEEGIYFCDDCLARGHVFEEGMGIFLYDDRMRKTISALKYHGRREYAEPLGTLMFRRSRDRLEKWKADAVVPIPIHGSRLRERGYNQAEELARPIAMYSGIPLRSDLLLRNGKTLPMKELSAEARRRNLEDAFRADRRKKIPGKILLVDDIFTTGATIDACASALLASGAQKVFFLTLSIGGGGNSLF